MRFLFLARRARLTSRSGGVRQLRTMLKAKKGLIAPFFMRPLMVWARPFPWAVLARSRVVA